MRTSSVIVGLVAGCVFINIGAQIPASQTAGTNESVTITGCFTADPEAKRFVVTAQPTTLGSGVNTRMQGVSSTYTYQLVPRSDLDMAQYAGKKVEVKGRIGDEVKHELEIEREEETTPP